MAKVRKKTKSAKREFISPFKSYWNKRNYILLGVGLLLLIVGFYLMSVGTYDNPISLTVSPLILLTAYLIVFPLSILLSGNKKSVEQENDTSKSNG